jgi:DNA (cytosine-5)-methyltransferase 1
MMGKPKLLDLFCCSGGAGMGYHLAGFEVVGIDIVPRPNYPFTFIQADALDYTAQFGYRYDAVHASPPCQPHSRMTRLAAGKQKEHLDMIPQTRFMLNALGLPYIIENVAGSTLKSPVMLCGSQFPELRVYRHRYFESNLTLYTPGHFPHKDKTPSAGRGKSPKGYMSICSGGIIGVTKEEKNAAMGIDWMTGMELSQAIPPAYTEYLGKQLLATVRGVEILEKQALKAPIF